MSDTEGSVPRGRPRTRLRLSRRAKLGLGLLLTVVGLFVIGGTVPTAPGTLERALAVTGVAAVALWLGGILLGAGSRR